MGRRGPIVSAGVGVLILALVGCVPEPEPSESSGPTPSPSATTSTEPTPAQEPSDAVSLPESCDQVFSAALLERFTADGLPLNDPTLTMPSTDIAVATDLLSSLDSLRCTWGVASEVGIATTLATVDAPQAAQLHEAFTTQGMDCAETDGAVRCTIQASFDEEGGEGAGGEIHLLRDGVWVSTKWLNTDMTGYLDDIEATLWP